MKNPQKLKVKLRQISNLYDITTRAVYTYVKQLHAYIRLQRHRNQKLRRKLTTLRKTSRHRSKEATETLEKGTQVETEQIEAGNEIEPLDIKAFVDDIKKTAQDFDLKNRYIYEPTSGMYYDPETGYYYNAIYGLHYDGERGCYLKYNEQTQEYDFYSQVIPQNMLEAEQTKSKQKKRIGQSRVRNEDSAGDEERRDRRRRRRHHRSSSSSSSDGSSSPARRKRSKKSKKKSKKSKKSSKRRKSSDSSDTVKEEGELASTNSDDSVILVPSSSNEQSDSAEEFKLNYKDVAKKYPPSLRIVVKETNLSDLKVGSLFVVTCKGGSLGREGNHDVIIPDINISKQHLEFRYNEKLASYQFVDLGSRNGTVHNGAPVKVIQKDRRSAPQNILHGSIIQLLQTKLLCHIHDGNSTCGKCEPGLLVQQQTSDPADESKITKPVSHKEGLKLIQKRFGLENEKYVPSGDAAALDYKDRAATRRKVKGSTHEHEKTHAASLDQSIGCDNKGFKMLSKLGWNEGETLGKNDDGLAEPIPLTTNVGTSGLGSLRQQTIGPNPRLPNARKNTIWRKTQERFEKSAVFGANGSSGSGESD